jgi:TetR/AcrR family transcriptional regulator, cholesterol catabolism regulator
MKKKNPGSDEKRSEKVAAIGKAAARLFNEKGFLETSMDEISEAARLSKGGIYHYFSSKNEILYSILTHYMDLILGNLEQDLGGMKGSVTKLQFAIARHIELYRNNIPEARTLLHETTFLKGRHFKKIAEKEREYYRIIAGVLLDSMDGRIPKDRLAVLTFALLGMCNWIYAWYDPKGPVPPNELSQTIFTLFSGGLKAYEASGILKAKTNRKS